MLPEEYEKILFGIILKYPNSNNIPVRATAELTEDKFVSKQHRIIFRTIKNLISDNQVPSTVNLSIALNGNLNNIGGIEYLESLVSFFDNITMDEKSELGILVERIDDNGKARTINEILGKYHHDNLEEMLSKVHNIDKFLYDLSNELNTVVNNSKTGYKHISEAVALEEIRYGLEAKGEIVDLIPCGLPSLHKFMIPRPKSFGGIIGLSSSGKTSLAFQIALGVAQDLYHNNKKGIVSINSLETIGEDIVSKFACFIAKIDTMQKAAGQLSDVQKARYSQALNYVAKLPISYDDNPYITSMEVINYAKIQNLSNKRILGISDYSELFRDDASKTEEARVTEVSRNIRTIAWSTESCEILLAQFGKFVTNSLSKMGNLADSRHSSAYEQALDWGIVLNNFKQLRRRGIKFIIPDDLNSDSAYLDIQKNKKYATGTFQLDWIPELSMFRDLSKNVEAHYPIILPSYDF